MSKVRLALAGWVAAALMLATIAGISLSGEWPTDAPLERAGTHGILPLTAAAVARVEIAEGDRHGEFVHAPSGEWLSNGAPVDAAIAGHLNTAVRFLNISAPDRTFRPSDYNSRDMAGYGLDPPRVRVTLVGVDGPASSVVFGDATPTQISQYAHIEGQSDLYLLSRYVAAEWQLALDMGERAAIGETPAAGAGARSTSLLSPVSIDRIWAVELVADGRLVRFERDAGGNWFHHVGEHVHTAGGFMHRADPAVAPLIAAELAGIDRAPVESTAALHPDDAAVAGFGLEHPSDIMLLYSRDSSRPVARIELGGLAKDGPGLYARVEGRDAVVTIPGTELAHLNRLIELAGNAT